MLKKLNLIGLIVLTACVAKRNEDVSFLFVILSKDGEIKKSANGSYELILDHGDVEKVLAFSDRPYRIVRHIDGEVFMRNWETDSFIEDPPNAAVIIDQNLQTVVLLNMRIEGSKSIFQIRPDDSQSLNEISGKTQVYIDSNIQWECDYHNVSCSKIPVGTKYIPN